MCKKMQARAVAVGRAGWASAWAARKASGDRPAAPRIAARRVRPSASWCFRGIALLDNLQLQKVAAVVESLVFEHSDSVDPQEGALSQGGVVAGHNLDRSGLG